jgi:hypothetical protein
VLARVEKLLALFPKIAGVMRTLSAGRIPTNPADLPAELKEMFYQLVEAVKEAGN